MRTLLIIALTLLLGACTKIIFEQPQPQDLPALKKVPSEFHGNFELSVMQENVPLQIAENFVMGKDGKSFISDSLVVKQSADMLYVNRKVELGGKPYWEFYTFRNMGCGIFKGASLYATEDEMIQQIIEQFGGKKMEGKNAQEKYLMFSTEKVDLNALLESDAAHAFYMEKGE